MWPLLTSLTHFRPLSPPLRLSCCSRYEHSPASYNSPEVPARMPPSQRALPRPFSRETQSHTVQSAFCGCGAVSIRCCPRCLFTGVADMWPFRVSLCCQQACSRASSAGFGDASCHGWEAPRTEPRQTEPLNGALKLTALQRRD